MPYQRKHNKFLKFPWPPMKWTAELDFLLSNQLAGMTVDGLAKIVPYSKSKLMFLVSGL